MMGVGVLVLVWDVLRAACATARARGDNPWNAWTLEWATTSPPPPTTSHGACRRSRSARPLWDLQHPPIAGRGRLARWLAELRDEPGISDARIRRSSGSLAFIFSEATFFGALIVAFLEYRTRSPGPGPARPRRPADGALQPVPVRQQRHGLPGRAAPGSATISAASWPGGWSASGWAPSSWSARSTEYVRLYADGITISSNLFTSAFFTLTGFHGLHVFVGPDRPGRHRG